MAKTRNFLQNINLLNIFLFLVCFYFASYILFPIISLKISYTLPSTKSIDKDTLNESTPGHRTPSMSEYILISEENAFHPERKIPIEKKAEEQPPSLPKPEIVLYGTLISDNLSYAYLEDLNSLRNTPGRGRRQITLKKGDNLGGFVLKEIETDKIIMARGDEKLIIEVRNTQRSKAPVPSSTPPKQHSPATSSRRLVPLTPSSSTTHTAESSSKAVINPPQNAEEQAIINFFNK